jgi:Mrr N-terminal domain
MWQCAQGGEQQVPNIRVDQDVYSFLKDQAEPFVDTPNSVLRRLLGLEEQSVKDVAPAAADPPPTRAPRRPVAKTGKAGKGSRRRVRERGPRAVAGSLLPEQEYIVPLLRALAERGGSAPAREIIDSVGERLKDRLSPIDRDTLQSGVIRWQNRVQFVRLRLVEEGLLAKDSPRGVWSLTEAGHVRVSNVA